jgi:uncharacterized SAM-binding protein YcdF (DUF218 family)
MLILSKLLPLLVLPPGVILLLAVLGLLFKRRILVWIAILSLWILSIPEVGTALMHRLEMPFHRIPMARVRKADAIVVLSGMLKQTEGAPLGELGEAAERFEGGVDLFKVGKAPMIVFTAGYLPWQPDCKPEGDLLAERARLRGVPARDIRVTSRVPNTAGEAIATAALLKASPATHRNIILVTSAYHMQRAVMLFRAAGFDVEPYPVDFRATDQNRRTTMLDFIPDASGLDTSAAALREMIGRGIYRFGLPFMMHGKS